jgi:hypothetical protein
MVKNILKRSTYKEELAFSKLAKEYNVKFLWYKVFVYVLYTV